MNLMNNLIKMNDIGLDNVNVIRSRNQIDKNKQIFTSKNEIRNIWINDINKLKEKFNEDNDEIIDTSSGLRILNGDTKHLWFRDNIAMYFAIGRIFDENDKFLLTNILSYFDNSKRTYLSNFYKVLNFTDPVIQGFESKLNIGNGNYHFILIIISYPSLNDIKFATDIRYMNRGVAEYYTDTNKIKERMIEIIREYGLTVQLEREFESIEPITVSNSFSHKDIQFNIRDNIDKSKKPDLNIPQRIRTQVSQKDKQLGFDIRNINPLNKRINTKGSDAMSIPIYNKAIYSRITDDLQIDKSNRKEYKIYNDENDFIEKIMPDI